MTLKEMLRQAGARHGASVALRFKRQGQWQTQTYAEVLQRSRRVTQLLANEAGVKPGDRVALLLENRPEWVSLYFGIMGAACTAVPIDAKLQEQEVSHILRDSGAVALLAAAGSYPVIRDAQQRAADLRHIILIGGRSVSPEENRRIRYLDFDECMEKIGDEADGPDAAFDRHDPAPDDVASFIYTSGTTGRQKGAMLTHANFVGNVGSLRRFIQVRPDENFLLVLPLHHAFAFTANLLVPMASGCEISFVENLKTVGENIREVSPTLLIGVPLLIEKMFNRIMNGLKEKKLAYTLFRLGVRAPIKRGIAAKLGGRLRLVVTGGAPCDPAVLDGFGALGVPVVEGYGLTETAPVLTLNPLHRPKAGTVGMALPDVQIRIHEPNAEGIGEIVTKGPNVMKGYFNNPAATAEVFEDGWLLTGDLGRIDDEGYVTITGRKKSLIVNREGKNIYPEEVEHALSKSPFIREILALGFRDAGQKVGEQVGVIVVPDQDALDAYAQQHKKTLAEQDIRDLIRAEVKKCSAGIAEYKRPRRIQVRWEEFEKTSTGKVKRYLYEMGAQDVT